MEAEGWEIPGVAVRTELVIAQGSPCQRTVPQAILTNQPSDLVSSIIELHGIGGEVRFSIL